MGTTYLKDHPDCEKIIREMDREVLELLYKDGKSPADTTLDEIAGLGREKTLNKLIEDFYTIHQNYINEPYVELCEAKDYGKKLLDMIEKIHLAAVDVFGRLENNDNR